VIAALGVLALVTAILVPIDPRANAAATLTVAEAIAAQDGATHSVTGYVVGQPTATSTVVRTNFPNDYALALADTAGETSTARMIYVQLPSGLRTTWGLASNPSLLGSRVTVTGTLTAYFSHPGVKSTSTISPAGSEPSTSPSTTSPTITPTSNSTTPSPTGEPDDYYAAAYGKSGADLKSALHQIIKVQTRLSYSQVWEALQATDEDPVNPSNVILFYSGRSQAKAAHGGGVDDWNREHVWAKSHGDFGTATGPGTDLHHLRPTDVSVNSTRGNLDFDEGGQSVYQCDGCRYDGDSFEPPDGVKGDVARMILYMAVRYEGDDGFPDLEVNNQVNNGSQPYIGKLSMLLAWNEQDPPSAFEKHRNEVIYTSYQHNRNPFIDHPEWVASIFG